MKRILHIHHTFRDQSYNSRLWNLAQQIDRDKYQLFACCLKEGGPYEKRLRDTGINVSNLGLKNILDVRIIPRLIKYIKENRIDVVHTSVFPADVYGRIAAKLAGVPFIFSTTERFEEHKQEVMYLLLCFADTLTIHLTTKVVAISNAVKDYLIRWHRVKPDRIEVIYNGVDVKRFDITLNHIDYKTQLGLDPDKAIVCTIARLVPVKGLETLIEAAAEVLKDVKEAQFLIVGDGLLKKQLESRVSQLNIDGAFVFTGFRNDIPEILSIVDVFVMPSLSEGLGNAILEAMAAGKPVVASNVGGISEAVLHNKTGFLVPPRDSYSLAEAIIRLLQSKQTRLRMGNEGKRHVMLNFNMKKMVSEYENFYDTYTGVPVSQKAKR